MATLSRPRSAMTDKQMGRAAAEGRRMRFVTGVVTYEGYLVGADDFHWMVAVPASSATTADFVVMVHKSCPSVEISTILLDEQPSATRQFVERIGHAYWAYCKKTYLGHTTASDQEQK